MANTPEETKYKSAYSTMIDDLVNKAINREEFKYDPATDAAYQSYARQYARLGNEAAQDTLADVSAQTGGLASSWAVTAAQQVRNNYNQALTDKIPSLMEAAYNKYRNEYNDRLAGISALQGLDDSAYERFANDRAFNEDVRRYGIDDAFRNKQFDRSVLESDRAFNEDVRRYAIDDLFRNKEFDEGVRQYNQNFGYQRDRDLIADQQWQKQFDESVRQYDNNYGLDKDSAEFEKMLNTWATLGYATKKIAKYFGVKEGTKTNEAAYQAAQLALQKANGSSGGRGGSRRGGGRRSGYGGSTYQSGTDKYGKYYETKDEGLYKDNPYNQALNVASQKLQNGATEQQIMNYLGTVKGLTADDITRIKKALGFEKMGKNDHSQAKDSYAGNAKALNK